MTEKKTKKPLTADEILAMDDDQVHAWVSRKLAERLAEAEQRRAEKEGRRGAKDDE